MAGSAYLNIGLIREMIRGAAEDALDDIGDIIATDARRRAPIRKVFREKKGYKRKFRSLTPAEKALAIQRANNYYGRVAPDEFKRRRAVAHIQNYARVQVARPGSANALVRSRELRFLGIESGGRFTSVSGASRLRQGGFEPGPAASEAMTSRGRYETRSGEAIHRAETASGTQVRVGGALKASIEADPVVQTGNGQSVTVAARIRYAKFVEFPTVRTAAQPFLLPALQGQRQRLPELFAANLRRAFGGR
jgi:HK97 gp10 family phage protein